VVACLGGAQVNSFSAQACSNILWSLAVLQATSLPVFQPLVDQLTNRPAEEIHNMEDMQLHQLFQVHSWLRLPAHTIPWVFHLQSVSVTVLRAWMFGCPKD
jgi:hypothetical protein